MSAARLVLRIVVATVTVIALGTIAVYGWTLIEPFSQAFSVASGLGWEQPGDVVLGMAAAAFLGLLLVLIIWTIAAPIRQDTRQQFRR